VYSTVLLLTGYGVGEVPLCSARDTPLFRGPGVVCPSSEIQVYLFIPLQTVRSDPCPPPPPTTFRVRECTRYPYSGGWGGLFPLGVAGVRLYSGCRKVSLKCSSCIPPPTTPGLGGWWGGGGSERVQLSSGNLGKLIPCN
jgi:hypothetical protein